MPAFLASGLRLVPVVFLPFLLSVGPSVAQQATGRLTVELNKFEDDPGGSCRAANGP